MPTRWPVRTRDLPARACWDSRTACTQGFCERLVELLADNMVLQARAGADCVALFDTAAGSLDPAQFARHAVQPLARVVARFRAACPSTPLIYYSRDTGPDHWRALEPLDAAVPGRGLAPRTGRDAARADAALVPAGQSRSGVAAAAGRGARVARARGVRIASPHCPRRRAPPGCAASGHGVLPQTPESNVHLVLKIQREMFS